MVTTERRTTVPPLRGREEDSIPLQLADSFCMPQTLSVALVLEERGHYRDSRNHTPAEP